MEWPLALVLGLAGGLLVGLSTGYTLWSRRKGEASAPAAPPSPRPGEALRLLALLQREARLLDFFLEDLTPYGDAQVGAAVRDIHRNCKKVLDEHLVLEPVLAGKEEERITVPDGFDPAAIQLTGNVAGPPPFAGTLKHHGWRAREVKLPTPPASMSEMILMPAEVEI